jgi:hypothetical protein
LYEAKRAGKNAYRIAERSDLSAPACCPDKNS